MIAPARRYTSLQFPGSHPAWPRPSNFPKVPVSADAPLGVRAAVLVHVHLRAHVEHDAAHLGVCHRPEADRVEGVPGDADSADVDAVGGAALVRAVAGEDDFVVAAGNAVQVRLRAQVVAGGELGALPVRGSMPARVDPPRLGDGVSRDRIARPATLHLRRLELLHSPLPRLTVDQLQTALIEAPLQ